MLMNKMNDNKVVVVTLIRNHLLAHILFKSLMNMFWVGMNLHQFSFIWVEEYVRHGYPWVPTDQAQGRPRQMGPA
jgi:hypothetical protein